MTTETRRILNIAGPVASLNNGQKGIETTTDTDTGVKSYVYKDYSGGEHKLLTTESPIKKIQGLDVPDVDTTEDLTNIEVLTNGSLDDWTGDDPDGWTVSTEDANNYITEDNGRARIVSDGSTIQMSQTPVTAGIAYRITWSVKSYTTGILRGGGTTAGTYLDVAATGDFSHDFIAGSTTVLFEAIGATDITFDNISCSEINSVANTDKKIVLETAINNVLYSEDFDNASWVKTLLLADKDTNVISNEGNVYLQGLVGTSTSGHHNTTQAITLVEGVNTLSVEVKQGAKTWVRLEEQTSGSFGYFDIANMIVGSLIGPVINTKMTPHQNGNVTVEMQFRAASTSGVFRLVVAVSNSNLTYTGDDSTIDIYATKFWNWPGTIADRPKYATTTSTVKAGTSTLDWGRDTARKERAGFLKIANSNSWGVIETGVEYEAPDSLQHLGFGGLVYCQYVNELAFTTGSYQSIITGIEGASDLRTVSQPSFRYRFNGLWYVSCNDYTSGTVFLLRNLNNTTLQISVGSTLATEFEGLIYYTKN